MELTFFLPRDDLNYMSIIYRLLVRFSSFKLWEISSMIQISDPPALVTLLFALITLVLHHIRHDSSPRAGNPWDLFTSTHCRGLGRTL